MSMKPRLSNPTTTWTHLNSCNGSETSRPKNGFMCAWLGSLHIQCQIRHTPALHLTKVLNRRKKSPLVVLPLLLLRPYNPTPLHSLAQQKPPQSGLLAPLCTHFADHPLGGINNGVVAPVELLYTARNCTLLSDIGALRTENRFLTG